MSLEQNPSQKPPPKTDEPIASMTFTFTPGKGCAFKCDGPFPLAELCNILHLALTTFTMQQIGGSLQRKQSLVMPDGSPNPFIT